MIPALLALYYAACAMAMAIVLLRKNAGLPAKDRLPRRKIVAVSVFWLPVGLWIPWLVLLDSYLRKEVSDGHK